MAATALDLFVSFDVWLDQLTGGVAHGKIASRPQKRQNSAEHPEWRAIRDQIPLECSQRTTDGLEPYRSAQLQFAERVPKPIYTDDRVERCGVPIRQRHHSKRLCIEHLRVRA